MNRRKYLTLLATSTCLAGCGKVITETSGREEKNLKDDSNPPSLNKIPLSLDKQSSDTTSVVNLDIRDYSSIDLGNNRAIIGSTGLREIPDSRKPTSDRVSHPGRVAIIKQNDTTWTVETILKPESSFSKSNLHTFGIDVALQKGTAFVCGGGPSVSIFTRQNGHWQRETKLNPPDEASTVAVQDEHVFVGDPGTGILNIYEGAGDWTHQATVKVPDPFSDELGRAISVNGNVAFIGADESAHALVRRKNTWKQTATLLGNEWNDPTPDTEGGVEKNLEKENEFGHSVALSDGTALVGARHETISGVRQAGAVYVYEHDNGVWTKETRLTASDLDDAAKFGSAVALDHDLALIGEPGTDRNITDSASGRIRIGAAHLFEQTSNGWKNALDSRQKIRRHLGEQCLFMQMGDSSHR